MNLVHEFTEAMAGRYGLSGEEVEEAADVFDLVGQGTDLKYLVDVEAVLLDLRDGGGGRGEDFGFQGVVEEGFYFFEFLFGS